MYVARMEEMSYAYNILVENRKGSNNLGNLGVNVRIILKCI